MLYLHHPTSPHDSLLKERWLLAPVTKEKLRSGKVNDRPNVLGPARKSQDSRLAYLPPELCFTDDYPGLWPNDWNSPFRPAISPLKLPETRVCPSATTTDLFSLLAFVSCSLITPRTHWENPRLYRCLCSRLKTVACLMTGCHCCPIGFCPSHPSVILPYVPRAWSMFLSTKRH